MRSGAEGPGRRAYEHSRTEEGRGFHHTTADDRTPIRSRDSILFPSLCIALMSEWLGQRTESPCWDLVFLLDYDEDYFEGV